MADRSRGVLLGACEHVVADPTSSSNARQAWATGNPSGWTVRYDQAVTL